MSTKEKRYLWYFFWLFVVPISLGWYLVLHAPVILGADAAALPVYRLDEGLLLPQEGRGNVSLSATALVHLTGPTHATPGATATYAITLTNFEAMTRTFTLTNTLPAPLTYHAGSSRELRYNPATRQLTWQGDIPPGYLDYAIAPSGLALPYIDLADFGAPNLCEELIITQGNCDEATVTLNLGANGYSFPFYGQTWYSLTLSPNGLLLVGAAASLRARSEALPHNEAGSVDSLPFWSLEPTAIQATLSPGRTRALSQNQWLPTPEPPGALVASLWYDADMTTNGRWHAAILQGLITGYDVLYVQWHDAPHAAAPNLTTRHAAALLLGDGPLSGQVFFIYDNISDPMALVEAGYTIGVEDYPGTRGTTYAYAPCCGDPHPPQGFPPASGTTLHLQLVIYGADFSRTFTYTVQVGGQIPQTIANTAEVTTSSPDPSLVYGWSTHYLYLRHLTFLPFIGARGAS